MLNLKNAYFTGKDEFPVLRAQSNDFQRPFQMIRFSDRKDASLNDAICFYEWDLRFERQLDDQHLVLAQLFSPIIVFLLMNH